MFARIATFDGIDVEETERTMDAVRERVEPMLRQMPGFQGYMERIDRAAQRTQTIAWFDSEENMHAAEPMFDEEMPRQLADLFEQWSAAVACRALEVLVDERS